MKQGITVIPAGRAQRSSLYTSIQVARHTRREAGIQCQGWQSMYIHVTWIPAIHAGMTGFVTLVYNDESVARVGRNPEHKDVIGY